MLQLICCWGFLIDLFQTPPEIQHLYVNHYYTTSTRTFSRCLITILKIALFLRACLYRKKLKIITSVSFCSVLNFQQCHYVLNFQEMSKDVTSKPFVVVCGYTGVWSHKKMSWVSHLLYFCGHRSYLIISKNIWRHKSLTPWVCALSRDTICCYGRGPDQGGSKPDLIKLTRGSSF